MVSVCLEYLSIYLFMIKNMVVFIKSGVRDLRDFGGKTRCDSDGPLSPKRRPVLGGDTSFDSGPL